MILIQLRLLLIIFFILFRTNSSSRTENEQNATRYTTHFKRKSQHLALHRYYIELDVCRHYSIGLKIHPHSLPISNFLLVFLWIGLKNIYAFPPQTQLLCKKPTYIILDALPYILSRRVARQYGICLSWRLGTLHIFLGIKLFCLSR